MSSACSSVFAVGWRTSRVSRRLTVSSLGNLPNKKRDAIAVAEGNAANGRFCRRERESTLLKSGGGFLQPAPFDDHGIAGSGDVARAGGRREPD